MYKIYFKEVELRFFVDSQSLRKHKVTAVMPFKYKDQIRTVLAILTQSLPPRTDHKRDYVFTLLRTGTVLKRLGTTRIFDPQNRVR